MSKLRDELVRTFNTELLSNPVAQATAEKVLGDLKRLASMIRVSLKSPSPATPLPQPPSGITGTRVQLLVVDDPAYPIQEYALVPDLRRMVNQENGRELSLREAIDHRSNPAPVPMMRVPVIQVVKPARGANWRVVVLAALVAHNLWSRT